MLAGIDVLFFKEGDTIRQGEQLGIIENTANAKDVLYLGKKLNELEDITPQNILDFKPEKQLRLGEIRGVYTNYAELYDAYEAASASSYDIQKIRQIRDQIENIGNINTELNNQKTTLVKEEELAQLALDRQRTLLADGASTQQDVENSQVYVLQKKTR